MITRITAENFKCLKNVDVRLRGLTVLAGLNGSGKSSLVQALTYMRQCILHAEGTQSHVKLRDEGLSMGCVSDVFYQFSPDPKGSVSVSAEVGDADGTASFLYQFEYGMDKRELDVIEVEEIHRRVPDEKVRKAFDAIRRLVSERIGPRDEHDYSESAVRKRNIGEKGENAVAYLYAYGDDEVPPKTIKTPSYNGSANLAGQVSAWMRTVSKGVSVSVDAEHKSDKTIPLYFKYGSGTCAKRFRPSNVGTGVSAVLPVLVLLLSAKKGDCLVIENPESDLHPKGQAELARLIAKVVQGGVQVILETHSDHIVNGIRVAVKKKEVDSDKVNIIFFRKEIEGEGTDEEEQYSDFADISLDRNGTPSKYPSDFMEEWGILLDQLLEEDSTGESSEGSDDGFLSQ